MVHGHGQVERSLSDSEVRAIVSDAVGRDADGWRGHRVLVIIPDGTRSAPIPLMFRVLQETLAGKASRLDFIVALGTHQPMPPDAIDKLVGMPEAERTSRYPNTRVINHTWDQPGQLSLIGTLQPDEVGELSGGMLRESIPVTINKLVHEYDRLVICGPVFPHEVAGYSGGAKYLFPGIAGAEIINASHWLGALATSMATIGVKETLVRKMLHRAATFVDKPILNLALVMKGSTLHGLFAGDLFSAWSSAADLSAELNIVWLDKPARRVLSMPSTRYLDMWTAAKAMYKTEPCVADGGEVIIYAPHIAEVSVVHGETIDKIGYHVRDYFLKQWDRFKDIPRGVLAHSTHVKGAGAFEDGVEKPRVKVTLSTAIPEERTRRISLGYQDPAKFDAERWEREAGDGDLVVHHAGEVLYRVRGR